MVLEKKFQIQEHFTYQLGSTKSSKFSIKLGTGLIKHMNGNKIYIEKNILKKINILVEIYNFLT